MGVASHVLSQRLRSERDREKAIAVVARIQIWACKTVEKLLDLVSVIP